MRCEKLFTHVGSRASVVSLLESGEQRYIKAINNYTSAREPVWPSGKALGL